MRWDTSAVWRQNHWLLIRDDFTGLWLDCLQISFSSSEGTHITQNIWLDWAGSGATSHACTGRPGITSETASAPVLPQCVSPRLRMRPPPSVTKSKKRFRSLEVGEEGSCKEKKQAINVPGKGEERKDTSAQKEWLHLALMCSFPQDGSSPENTE